jgi:hypothetical protein
MLLLRHLFLQLVSLNEAPPPLQGWSLALRSSRPFTVDTPLRALFISKSKPSLRKAERVPISVALSELAQLPVLSPSETTQPLLQR